MQDFSIGILSWHSTDVLIHTLESYHDNGLFDLSDDVNIYFQEINDEDRTIATHFKTKYMGTKENVGIGQGFLKLASAAKYDNILLLEHDWELATDHPVMRERLEEALFLLDNGYDCVRLRHRTMPGFPHFSERHYTSKEMALAYHDPEIDLKAPHLLDSLHWIQNPDQEFPGRIGKQQVNGHDYYVASSRYANFTNNPCVYKKNFYLQTVKQFVGKGIELEGKISYWWARQLFNVAQGSGIFTHYDPSKYGDRRK